MLRKTLLALALLAGCSSESTDVPSSAAEAGADTGALVDDTAASDTATPDTASPDSAPADSATTPDAADSSVVDSGTAADAALDEGITWDTAAACHGFGFGAPPATITKVASLPTMTGGTVVAGVYDAVSVQTTGTTMGTYRATWRFVADMKLEAIEQLTLSAAPPTPVPRILTWSTSGTTLNRTQICGGTATFSNQYTVRTESGATYLDVRQDTVLFTFRKR